MLQHPNLSERLQPDRNWNSDNYRFGFNGKMNDNDIYGEANALDFGARIYDPRLGRWLSLDPEFMNYPNVSPFSFGLDNPVLFIDNKGTHIVDANGNIVYTKQDVEPEKKIIGIGLIAVYQKVFIYANDGTQVEAYLVTVLKQGEDVTAENSEQTYDCHGLTQTQGKFFIDSGEPIEKLLTGDRGGTLTEKSIDEKIAGDIIVFRNPEGEIIHTCIYNGDDTYTSKNGTMLLQEKEKFIVLKVFYASKTGSTISAVSPVEDLKLNSLQNAGSNGIAEYSSEEVNEALNNSEAPSTIESEDSDSSSESNDVNENK